jgi:glycosyltransferase involved in cell wall biosynthesis
MSNLSGKKNFRILVLEPYYGGSHKSFLTGLTGLPFDFELMTLPARKWKWRMRLSAPYFAQMLQERGSTAMYDRIVCSTFVDVAAFRGLAPSWVREVPVLTYFHENQFAYPVQFNDERDFHFALTNVTTALASDSLAFNSRYNLGTFLRGIRSLQGKSYDLKLDDPCGVIEAKSGIIQPGIDFSVIDRTETPKRSGPPAIVWNHRWEHDKNPELFFRTLYSLDSEGIDFRLIVLGESFKEHPPVFEEAARKLSGKVLHIGYVKSRRSYAEWLRRGDIVVSTAGHEFFGISVIEAVRAGCRPLLPDRLSYPEMFPGEFLYDEKNFYGRMKKAVLKKKRLSPGQAREFTDRFSWDALGQVYREWILKAGYENPAIKKAR